MSYTINNDIADEITLSNGKKYYTGVDSMRSKEAVEAGLTVKRVKFKGCCISCNINSRALDEQFFPIKINGYDIYECIDMVASVDEPII